MPTKVMNTDGSTGSDVDSLTWTHESIPALKGSVLVVLLAGDTSGDVVPIDAFSVTAGGVAMTQLIRQGATREWASIYYLINPPSGNISIVASCDVSGGGNNRGVLGSSLVISPIKGVGATDVDTNGTAATLTMAVKTAGSILVKIFVQRSSSSNMAHAAGETSLSLGNIGSGSAQFGSSYKIVGNGNQSVGVASGDGGDAAIVAACFEFRPGGALLVDLV